MERVISSRCAPEPEVFPGLTLRVFASARVGAKGLSTGTATCGPGAEFPYHLQDFSEAITVLCGEGTIEVQGRVYRLRPLDCAHIPAGVPHRVANLAGASELVMHWAFASATPLREMVDERFVREDRDFAQPRNGDPESIVRFGNAPEYELAAGTRFYDLFAGRFGSVGICGGYGEFNPGSSLPCHSHKYDESISIVKGEAICEVMGRRYRLSGCDTAMVPKGRPHRFLNESSEQMAMIWVYAGSEPERTIVDTGYCLGTMAWPGPESFE